MLNTCYVCDPAKLSSSPCVFIFDIYTLELYYVLLHTYLRYNPERMSGDLVEEYILRPLKRLSASVYNCALMGLVAFAMR